MDPTVQFFAKLKKVAVTLETDTAKLQHAFDNRHNDDDSGEWYTDERARGWALSMCKRPCNSASPFFSDKQARAMRAYHELNRDVGNLKVKLQVT